MSTTLRNGVQRLELTSRVTLGVLALGSGLQTYLGARELLNDNSTLASFAAVIYSIAVTIGIFAFWSFMMRLLPFVFDRVGRILLLVVMAVGSVMIVAMSAWLNATALADKAALEQHLAATLQDYSRDLNRAYRYATSAQILLPDIQMASARFGQLADGERTGTLTGTSGTGTVVQLLSQMSNRLGALSRTVEQSSAQAKTLYGEGSKHLAKMRELISSRGPISPRGDAFGNEATALLGVIASLQQTGTALAVKRTAHDLAASFIAPVAGGRTELGRGHFDRSLTGGAGHHLVHSARQHSSRGCPAGDFDLNDDLRPDRSHSLGAPGRSRATHLPLAVGRHRHAGIPAARADRAGKRKACSLPPLSTSP